VGDVDGVSIITVVAGPVSPLLVYRPVSVVDVVVNVPVQGTVVVVMIPGAVDEGELWGEELDGTDELDGPELLGVSTITVVAGTVWPLVVTGPVSVVEVVVKEPVHGTVVVVMMPDTGEVGDELEGVELLGAELVLDGKHTDTLVVVKGQEDTSWLITCVTSFNVWFIVWIVELTSSFP